MIIADTCVWIEFLRGNDDVSLLFKPYLTKGHIYTLSAIFGELFQGAKNKREQAVLTEFWDHLPRINESGLFIAAGKLSNKYKLYASGIGLIDSYILAAAQQKKLALWTLDKKLSEAVNYIIADTH